jgi:uncharacterized protein YbaA (DUF1428 family)
MTYIEGFVCAVPTANKEEYRKHAVDAAPIFKEFGVTRMVENWGDDVPEGKVTDFAKSVQAKDDAANAKIMADPRMEQIGANMPFDGKRMIMGGFDSIVDEATSGTVGYTDGFVVPVQTGKKGAYLEMAEKMAGKFKEEGALRVVEGWGDDVPDGKVTDFKRAVRAQDGENIVYSYVQWPDKVTRDAAWAKMMNDPELQPSGEMPFDGQRMFWGGFQPIVDTAAE